ncbi:hypothetical protein I4U23_011207 [Adineta vaga]|nr:hypothetical protein I4U23_011207 [Adineta vaga]
MQPLSSYGNSSESFHTNLSRLFSLSILDENQIDLQINPIEFFIPRDPNLNIPEMFLQNLTNLNKKHLQFHFYLFNLTKNYSIHFEIHPLQINISYLLIYEFDHKPQINLIENWIFLYGVLVGPLTNHYRTQCFLTHLKSS